jgi:hypothetical protein
MILQGLKPRIYIELNKFGMRCLTELPSVIWSLRTTPSQSMGLTPFFLVYGVEAILPTDLEHGSPRLRAFSEHNNQVNYKDSLDQLEEARDVALLHSARYHSHLGAITQGVSDPRDSRTGTWYFGYGKTTKGATSSLLHRKDLSSSRRC